MLPTKKILEIQRHKQIERKNSFKKVYLFQVAILLSDKTDIMTESIPRAKDRHFMMIKESIHQEDIIIITYALNNRAPKYM